MNGKKLEDFDRKVRTLYNCSADVHSRHHAVWIYLTSTRNQEIIVINESRWRSDLSNYNQEAIFVSFYSSLFLRMDVN